MPVPSFEKLTPVHIDCVFEQFPANSTVRTFLRYTKQNLLRISYAIAQVTVAVIALFYRFGHFLKYGTTQEHGFTPIAGCNCFFCQLEELINSIAQLTGSGIIYETVSSGYRTYDGLNLPGIHFLGYGLNEM